jgi:hypothetical protein
MTVITARLGQENRILVGQYPDLRRSNTAIEAWDKTQPIYLESQL